MTTRNQSGGRGDKREGSRRSGRARSQRDRQISVRAVRREKPDLRKLGRAIVAIALAEAQAEADAQAIGDDIDRQNTAFEPKAGDV